MLLQQSTGGWSFVTTPETLCWSYLQHLEDHLHQFVVYIKSTHHNFLDSLLQQYNFGISIIEVSEMLLTQMNQRKKQQQNRKQMLI